MPGNRSRERMSDETLAAGLAVALILAGVGAPGLGGLVAAVFVITYLVTRERRSGAERRKHPARRRSRR